MEKKRILIVDDEAAFTNLVKMNLEGTGKYDVKVENKGSKGFDAALEFQPHLILLDIIMPDKPGPDVAAQIKQDQRLKDIPVVFLTAAVLKEEIPYDGRIGGSLFISKPVTSGELIGHISKVLG